MHEADAPPVAQADEAVEIRRLFDGARGCDTFDQRILSFHDRSQDRLDTEADEVLYVLDGEATAKIEGVEHQLAPGSAAFIARGTLWSVEEVGSAEPLTVLSVLVHGPEAAGAGHAVLELPEEATHGATAGRQFSLGVTPEVGCASVTQFVGYIPVGRAPDHYHRYDEVVYVLAGDGVVYAAGDHAALEAGSCVHLPAGLVHCLENSGRSVMRVLGVFRPAGSPAEAYYPDGTPATVPDPTASEPSSPESSR
jgi:quercetin dioxygenase-like cupin family protein